MWWALLHRRFSNRVWLAICWGFFSRDSFHAGSWTRWLGPLPTLESYGSIILPCERSPSVHMMSVSDYVQCYRSGEGSENNMMGRVAICSKGVGFTPSSSPLSLFRGNLVLSRERLLTWIISDAVLCTEGTARRICKVPLYTSSWRQMSRELVSVCMCVQRILLKGRKKNIG